MSREKELQQEIEALNGEIKGFRSQVAPLMRKIERRFDKMKALKKELWDLRKDDFPALLKESEAFVEMKDFVARRFAVRNGDEAPVAPAGHFPQTGEQAFRIKMESGTDSTSAAEFIREILQVASPVSHCGKAFAWRFEVMTPDLNSSGVVTLVTEDRESFWLVKMRHSREKPLTEPGSLEDMLAEIRKCYAMDVEETEEDAFSGWSR